MIGNTLSNVFKNEIILSIFITFFVYHNSLSKYFIKICVEFYFSYLLCYNIFKYKVSSGIMNGGGVRSDIPIGEFTYGDLIKIYPFENVTTILKMDKSQYDTFTTSSGMYIVKDDIPSTTDGYYYVVTNDYSGYKANYTSLFAYDDYLIRDIISSNLKIRGYY